MQTAWCGDCVWSAHRQIDRIFTPRTRAHTRELDASAR